MSGKPLKAYSVLEEDEGTGGIVFARHSIVALREGASRFGDGDIRGWQARRAPWADEFAESGRVPFAVRFDHGWWCECHACGQTIREDAEDDSGEPLEFDIVEYGDAVYCRPACREERLARKAEDDRIKRFVIGDLTDRLLRAMPGAIIAGEPHVYVRSGPLPRAPQQGAVYFAFPGARHGLGCFRFDKIGEKPQVTICYGDRVAFYSWQQAGYPPHMMDASEAA